MMTREILHAFILPNIIFYGGGVGSGFLLRSCHERQERRIPPSFESATLEQCSQSEQVCNAVAERLGIHVTIPPWQAMVLTPILDPR